MSPIEEATIYRDGDVLVTSTRAVLGGTTYAMSNITAVSLQSKYANRGPGVAILGLGIVAGLCVSNIYENIGNGVVVFILCALIAGAQMLSQHDQYFITLTTASGETKALQSTAREDIQEIVDAITEAIIRRG